MNPEPLARSSQIGQDSGENKQENRMAHEKILVIDDEKATLKMFRLFLDVYGFDILTAESGEEGLEVFDREKPEIVLTDTGKNLLANDEVQEIYFGKRVDKQA